MPHIHVVPDQHDMTVSAYIVRRENDEWKCLVHFHNKIEKLMQIGGHIELNETPWQAMAHELEEETGYQLNELELLQYTDKQIAFTDNIPHPIPFSMNTHNVGNEHYHSDMCFGFVAQQKPQVLPGGDESTDLRWLSLEELTEHVERGEALADVVQIYDFLLQHITTLSPIPADNFSLQKPANSGLVYKRGAPGQ